MWKRRSNKTTRSNKKNNNSNTQEPHQNEREYIAGKRKNEQLNSIASELIPFFCGWLYYVYLQHIFASFLTRIDFDITIKKSSFTDCGNVILTS